MATVWFPETILWSVAALQGLSAHDTGTIRIAILCNVCTLVPHLPLYHSFLPLSTDCSQIHMRELMVREAYRSGRITIIPIAITTETTGWAALMAHGVVTALILWPAPY
jgi:hypothetical protein